MWTLQDAKNKFSAVVAEALAGTPQEVSRRGEPAVVVVSIEHYAELKKAASQNRKKFVDHLLDFPSEDVERASVEPRDVAF